MALMKLCSMCGIVRLPIGVTYCPKCAEIKKKQRNEDNKKRRERKPQTEPRDEIEALYKGRAWLTVRKAVLNRDNFLCVLCVADSKKGFGDIVHHITPAREDMSLFYNTSNLISVCTQCHSNIHMKYDSGLKEQTQSKLKLLVPNKGYLL